MPLVTIGIPTYNRSRTLLKALQSALAQDHPELEVVVADNGSSDDTEKLCIEAAQKEPRLRYLRHPANRGPVFNFLSALDEARGEFFMWLADDDWLEPAYVSRCLAHLQAHRECALAAGRAHYYRQDQPLFVAPPISVRGRSGAERVRSFFTKVQDNFSMHGLARRSDWLRLRWCDVIGGDWLMVAGIAFQGDIATIEETAIHRDFTWSAARTEEMARDYGLPQAQGQRPYLTIAQAAAWDITWRNPVYRTLSLPARLLLAGQCAALVCRRHDVLGVEGKRLLRRVLRA